jgi:hypothetical protein
MADLEGMTKLKLKILDCEDAEKRDVLIKKLERLKTWEHPRVTEKMAELRMRNFLGETR